MRTNNWAVLTIFIAIETISLPEILAKMKLKFGGLNYVKKKMSDYLQNNRIQLWCSFANILIDGET